MSVHKPFDIDALLEALGAIEFGVIHWFNHDQGFGFITPHAGGSDIFVDLSEVVRGRHRPLQVGQRVSYRLGGIQQWPQASSVHVL